MKGATLAVILASWIAAAEPAGVAGLAGVAGAAGVAEAAVRVTGVVRTALRPLGGVHVLAPENGQYAQTDSLGRFEFWSADSGSYELQLFAVGYEPLKGRFIVGDQPVVDTGEWLLVPLRPDGDGVGLVPPESAIGEPGTTVPLVSATLPPAAFPSPTFLSDSLLADSLLRLPPPPPVTPAFTLYLTDSERTRFLSPAPTVDAARPEAAVREIVLAIVTADSITNATLGTGAPGYESWKQWSERLALLERDSTLADSGPMLRRIQAYTRTRAAFAAGATYAGWLAAQKARTSLADARRDSAGGTGGIGGTGGSGGASAAPPESLEFLAGLSSEL
ncbi:MAG: hypothetical protein ACREOU_06500, partial [Candidatus Eiseniibacteriota bacterium]